MLPDYTAYPAMRQVTNAALIWDHFGYWPTFHDAEVVSVVFKANSGWYHTVTFTISACETTAEVKLSGHFKQVKHCLIELEFTEIIEFDFDYFAHQNVLFELSFEEQGEYVLCQMPSSVGLEATVVAKQVLVQSLEPTTQTTP